MPDIATPLDLTRIPFVLASPKVAGAAKERVLGNADEAPEAETDERDAEALDRLPVLPVAAWQTRYDIVERYGRTLTIRVEGHSRLGMPRGRDLDVLLGVLTLYAEDYQRVLGGGMSRLVDGALADVSVNEILNAMGVSTDDRNGSASRRVRQALRRFGHLRFTSTGRVFRDASEEAAALLAGAPGAQPRVPDRGVKQRATPAATAGAASAGARVVAVDEEVTHLLEYSWQLSYERNPAGELRIVRLKLNDRFHQHLVTGWVAWIEAERYRALSSALARRLYVLLAGEAATGRPAPWTVDLRAVRTACGMSAERFANDIKKDLTRAALELVEHDVLAAPMLAESPRKGEWTLTFEPGPALAFVALLRGTSVLDLTGDRAQLAFLHYFGFDDAAARDLIAGAPHAVYDALCYALYVRETDPARVRRSWRGFIVDRVEANRPNTGDVGFAAWAAKRLAPAASAERASAQPAAAARSAARPEVGGPANDSGEQAATVSGAAPDTGALAAALPCDPAAAVLWAAVCDSLPDDAVDDVLGRQLLQHLVPVVVRDGTLTLATDLLFSRGTVARVRRAVADVAVQLAKGSPDEAGRRDAVHRVQIEHAWLGRDGATPVLRPMPGGASEGEQADESPAPLRAPTEGGVE